MNRLLKRVTALSICLLLVGLSGAPIASAQTSPRVRKDSKVIVLEGGVIEGKIEKPQVFYLLERHKIRFERLKMKRSFLKEILRSVRSNPF
jgi:hypothetical protein